MTKFAIAILAVAYAIIINYQFTRRVINVSLVKIKNMRNIGNCETKKSSSEKSSQKSENPRLPQNELKIREDKVECPKVSMTKKGHAANALEESVKLSN